MSNYANLNYYTPSLGITSMAAGFDGKPGNGSGPMGSNLQIVPVFAGVSYQHPNYNSLNNATRTYNPYSAVNDSYISSNCVKYLPQAVGVARAPGGTPLPQ